MSLQAPQIICALCMRDGNMVRAIGYEVTSGDLRIHTYLCPEHAAQADDAQIPEILVATMKEVDK